MADTMDEDTRTVFHKLGGWTPLKLAVSLFYDKVLADPLLAPFFDGVPMDRLIKKQMAFMAFAFGGASNFFGKTVQHAHRRLIEEAGLGLEHFDAVAGHFVATLKELGVSDALIGEAAGIVLTTRPLFDRNAVLAQIAEGEKALKAPVAAQLLSVQAERTGSAAGAPSPREAAGANGNGGMSTARTSDGGDSKQRVKVSTLVDVLAPVMLGQEAPSRVDSATLTAAAPATTAQPPAEAGTITSSSPGPIKDSGTVVVTADSAKLEAKRLRRQMLKDLLQGLSVLSTSGGGAPPAGGNNPEVTSSPPATAHESSAPVVAVVPSGAGIPSKPAEGEEEWSGSAPSSAAATQGTIRSGMPAAGPTAASLAAARGKGGLAASTALPQGPDPASVRAGSAVKVAAWLEGSQGAPSALEAPASEPHQPTPPGASQVALAAALPLAAAAAGPHGVTGGDDVSDASPSSQQAPVERVSPPAHAASRPARAAPEPLLRRVLSRGDPRPPVARSASSNSTSSGVSLPVDSDDELAAHLTGSAPGGSYTNAPARSPLPPPTVPASGVPSGVPSTALDLPDVPPRQQSSPGSPTTLSRVQVASLSTLSEVSEGEHGSTNSPLASAHVTPPSAQLKLTPGSVLRE